MGSVYPVQNPNPAGAAGMGLLTQIVRGLLLVTMFVCVVFPHSFQLVTAVLLTATFGISILVLRKSAWLDKLLALYFLGVIVTAFYTWYGYMSGAPEDAVTQTLVVYIVAPLLWLVVGAVLFQTFGIQRVVQLLVWASLIATVTVALFFYAFLMIGKDAVSFLIEDANVNVAKGYAGATLLVYGSLIFLSGALFAQPNIIKNKILRIFVPLALTLCAITSGRSGLILAIPIGIVVGIVLRGRVKLAPGAAKRRSILLPVLFLGIGAIGAVVVIDAVFDSIDLSVIFGEFFDELSTGGGSIRTEQAEALWEGVRQSNGLGVGHGIGVAYLRSDQYPWRYEIIPLASMLRVGFLGTLVYMSMFIVYGLVFTKRFMDRDLRPEDVYMLGGFAAAIMGIFTNPYIESFIFQWMYFLPVLSIAIRPNPEVEAED